MSPSSSKDEKNGTPSRQEGREWFAGLIALTVVAGAALLLYSWYSDFELLALVGVILIVFPIGIGISRFAVLEASNS